MRALSCSRAMTKPHAFVALAPDMTRAAAAVSVPCAEARAAGCEFRVASHDLLFAPTNEHRCDACGADLPWQADGDTDDYSVLGRGVYLWVRGGAVTIEHAPLCASCASAIGMTALARWEIEEEED
jgi:hypothetical protein